MSHNEDPYFRYTPPPPLRGETYEEKLDRYREGWRREWDNEPLEEWER